MSNLTLAQYTKAELALKSRLGQLARSERGADALEWVGMIVVAAIIVVAITGAINTEVITTALTKAIKGIVGSGS
ncbi:MAG: hypothetical protein ACK5LS_10990 [Propioniciclava sp.]